MENHSVCANFPQTLNPKRPTFQNQEHKKPADRQTQTAIPKQQSCPVSQRGSRTAQGKGSQGEEVAGAMGMGAAGADGDGGHRGHRGKGPWAA